MRVLSLGQEDPLATHSSILAWRIPWTEEPSGLQSMGSQRVGQNWSDWASRHSNLKFSVILLKAFSRFESSCVIMCVVCCVHWSSRPRGKHHHLSLTFHHGAWLWRSMDMVKWTKVWYPSSLLFGESANTLQVSGQMIPEWCISWLSKSIWCFLLHFLMACTQSPGKERTYCRAQGALLSVTQHPGWEGGFGEKGYMYMCDRVPSLFTWNNHNIVNRLYAMLCYAKSLQSCPTLCDPIDGSPPGSPIPGILQARTLEWLAISFSNAWKWRVKVKSLSRVRLLATPWTAA